MAWHYLNSHNAGYISSSRLDISLWLEHTGHPPPVAFSSISALRLWASQTGNMQVSQHGTSGQALRIQGWLQQNWYYDQIWAAKRYSGYRSLMIAHASNGFSINSTHLVGVDADHVVARTTLKHLSHAWLAIFPVPASANRPFGRIEKILPNVNAGHNMIELSPIPALKLFCGHYPSTRMELSQALQDVRGQFNLSNDHVANFVARMRKDILPYILK